MATRRRWPPGKAAILFRRYQKWLLPACCALVALVIMAIALAYILHAAGPQAEPPAPTPMIPDNMLQVEDLYNGTVLIPKFDLPACQYDTAKFKDEGRFIRYDDGKAVKGIDVSEFQGEIDWAQVQSSGMVDFAFIRIGYRGMTQGLLVTDERFEQNYQGATAAGIPVGVYFFSQAISEAEAEAEADYVLSVLDGRTLTYPIVFDWENPVPSDTLPAEDLRAYDAQGADVAAYGAAFCRRVKEAGYNPCFYTNKNMGYRFFDMDKVKDYPIWLAEYQKAPSWYYDFRIWQYTDQGTVPGITTTVDMDICFDPY